MVTVICLHELRSKRNCQKVLQWGGSAPPTPRWGSAPNPVFGPSAWILFLLDNTLGIRLDNRKRNEQVASCSVWKGMFQNPSPGLFLMDGGGEKWKLYDETWCKTSSRTRRTFQNLAMIFLRFSMIFFSQHIFRC